MAAQWPTTDFHDIGVMAVHWLTICPRCIPSDMAYILTCQFEMGDNFNDGNPDERPVHTVQLNLYYTGRYQTTNQQYCAFLNWADDSGWITVTSGVVYQAASGTSYPYCNTSTADSQSQIAYSGGVFSVRTKGGRNMANDPMVSVSWYGAVAYSNWRSQQEAREQCYDLSTWACDFSKKGYRLPTEAEWEYAARGMIAVHGGHRFPLDDWISHDLANYYSHWTSGLPTYPYDVNSTEGYHPSWNDGIYPYTSPVGSLPANPFGLYDMAGNVLEWCYDWYSSTYYSSSPEGNPLGPPSGTYRIVRGGSWDFTARECRVASRLCTPPHIRSARTGFRLVLSD